MGSVLTSPNKPLLTTSYAPATISAISSAFVNFKAALLQITKAPPARGCGDPTDWPLCLESGGARGGGLEVY